MPYVSAKEQRSGSKIDSNIKISILQQYWDIFWRYHIHYFLISLSLLSHHQAPHMLVIVDMHCIKTAILLHQLYHRRYLDTPCSCWPQYVQYISTTMTMIMTMTIMMTMRMMRMMTMNIWRQRPMQGSSLPPSPPPEPSSPERGNQYHNHHNHDYDGNDDDPLLMWI